MTQPGAPRQYPPHGQPYPPQQQYPQQRYPYPQGMPWGPPPRPRKRKGLLVGVLTVLLLGMTAGGLWLWEELDDPPPPPPVDASQDLDKAPIGCAMLDEEEVTPYIPGRFDYEKGGANAGTGEYKDQGQCTWSNTGTFTEDGVRGAHVVVTSYVYHANRTLSGVDQAKEHMASRERTGVAVHVADADDALLRELGDADHAVHLAVRYRNVVYAFDYSNQTEGAEVKKAATDLATIVVAKVVPEEDD